MEKKIGILSPHQSTNYGTQLQAYALSKVLADLGQDSEYISYTESYKRSIIERIWRKLKRMVGVKNEKVINYEGIDDGSFWQLPMFEGIKKKSDQFYEDYMPHTHVIYNPKTIWKINFKYHTFIVGSDQTWSMEQYNSGGEYYYFGFLFPWKKKLSYAPSLGTLHLSDKHKRILTKYLKSFDAVSCRERSNCIELSKMIRKEVTYVADPTLLLNKDYWEAFSSPVDDLPSIYILAYILGEKDCIVDFAERMSREKNIPVVYVLTRPKYLSMPHCLKDLSAQQWIYAISHADCIVTDSFHGSLFSINFEKDFYTFYKRPLVNNDFNDNDRILDLLSAFNLTERFVDDSMSKNKQYSSIDYKQVTPLVRSLVDSSLSYLEKMVKM